MMPTFQNTLKLDEYCCESHLRKAQMLDNSTYLRTIIAMSPFYRKPNSAQIEIPTELHQLLREQILAFLYHGGRPSGGLSDSHNEATTSKNCQLQTGERCPLSHGQSDNGELTHLFPGHLRPQTIPSRRLSCSMYSALFCHPPETCFLGVTLTAS
ncbi:hypothetical protein HPB48_013286 [Haemaphysalis longicornis]|uniref:Uncharacterized protein n=1 Tax=Haemaphysalis longicornis TaxID=44386 RepID=A0A9J6GTX6_HAELO|nr:hypothetical protein HPB48_013286 [Haemaphysalis longicornis]